MSDDLVKRLRTARNFSDIVGYLRPAADRIEALEKEALEWEARACAMFPYVPDDTKCGTLAKARDEAKVRLANARREALEEAARVADVHRDHNAQFPDYNGGYDTAAESIAHAIRALKEEE